MWTRSSMCVLGYISLLLVKAVLSLNAVSASAQDSLFARHSLSFPALDIITDLVRPPHEDFWIDGHPSSSSRGKPLGTPAEPNAARRRPGRQLKETDGDDLGPTLTIFCAPKPYTRKTDSVDNQRRALHSWLRLAGSPKIVLIGNHSSFWEIARMHPARIYVEPQVDTNYMGVPQMHSIVARASVARTDLSMIINADVVLLNDAILAIEKVHGSFSHWILTAARWDVAADFPYSFDPAMWEKTKAKSSAALEKEIRESVRDKGSLHTYGGVDLWVWNNNSPEPLFEGAMPPFAFGRGKYDNWMTHEMVAAHRRAVVDVSDAMTAIHVAHTYDHVAVGREKEGANGRRLRSMRRRRLLEETAAAGLMAQTLLSRHFLEEGDIFESANGEGWHGGKRISEGLAVGSAGGWRGGEGGDANKKALEGEGRGDWEGNIEGDRTEKKEAGGGILVRDQAGGGMFAKDTSEGRRRVLLQGVAPAKNFWSTSKKASWELFANIHMALTHGTYSNQKGTALHTPFKLAACLEPSAHYMCFQKRPRPAICTCEYSPFVHAAQSDPRLDITRTRWICGTISVDRRKEYSISAVPGTDPVPGLPHTMEQLLPQVARSIIDNGRELKVVTLVAVTIGYANMLMSFICRLRMLGLADNLVVAALDEELYRFAFTQGLAVYYEQVSLGLKNIDSADCTFGSQCFRKFTKLKSRAVLRVLKAGYSVLWTDVDIVWYSDPLPDLLSFGPHTFPIQSNEPNSSLPGSGYRRINSGFYFARAEPRVVEAFEAITAHAATTKLSEQPSFYDVLCGEKGERLVEGKEECEWSNGLRTFFLSRKLYPNGAVYGIWDKSDPTEYCRELGCKILHNNWIAGREAKQERFLKNAYWHWDADRRMCTWPWHKRLPPLFAGRAKSDALPE